ncbi:MAG TPA: prolyl aminopeptidase [Methylococcus sp.]|nr:prolyl aminopeptidase [Methylococcus sp.]
MRSLYPPIEPHAVHRLEVGGGHRIYVEECGNPHGVPVVFLHGGPGSGCKAYHRCFFDPMRYRIILLDQRGAGRSTPRGHLRHNTTAHLVADLERVREVLGIERWLLFGGSWGAALALIYAQTHPERVSGLILRGAFLARKVDVDWFVHDGANRIYPESWERFLAHFGLDEHKHLARALYRRLTGPDELERQRAAREWWLWSSRVTLGDAFIAEANDVPPPGTVDQSRIELHYAVHRYFIREGQILMDCHRIEHLPAILVHGRKDLVCPPESAWTLHRRLPRSELRMLPNAGHISAGEEMIDALVTAADEILLRISPTAA